MTKEEDEKESERLENLMKASAKMNIIRRFAEANDALSQAIRDTGCSISLEHYHRMHEIRELLEQLGDDIMKG
jgi:hypothetical protein